MKKAILNNWQLKILTLIFAFVFWRGVVELANPITTRTFRDIPITMLNEQLVTDRGKVYQVIDNVTTVSVIIKADTQTLNQIEKEYKTTNCITATADFEEIELGELVPVKISVTKYDGKIIEKTPNPVNLKVNIEDSASNKYPIVPAAIGQMNSKYSLGKMKVRPETVSISGPISIVETITRVEAQVSVAGIEEDAVIPAELLCYDENDLLVDQTLLTLILSTNNEPLVEVEVLDTKALPLKLETSGKPKDGYKEVGITAEPTEVVVAARKDVLEDLAYIHIPGSALDISGESGKVERVIDVSEYMPENVKLYDENTSAIAITIQIDEIGTKSVDIPVKSIAVYDNPEDMYFEYIDITDVMVTFSGTQDVLNSLDVSNVQLSMDLKPYKEEGIYNVPLMIKTIPGCELVETITVPIELKKI